MIVEKSCAVTWKVANSIVQKGCTVKGKVGLEKEHMLKWKVGHSLVENKSYTVNWEVANSTVEKVYIARLREMWCTA
jgi:hypothetical protein